MKNNTSVIVGGGIAGLVSAIIIKRRHPEKQVILIENESNCGGLLQSIKIDDYEFDYGTHIIGETGLKALDNIICPKDDEKWSILPKLKPGNIVNGYFYKMSQLLYAKALPKEILTQGSYELIAAANNKQTTVENLEDYCNYTYGETFTRFLFKPLMKKLTATSLEQLHPKAINLFGYNRVIIGEQKMMQELKQIPRLDAILGFSTYNEGVSALNNYYPKHGKGVGLWVDELAEQAQDLGVTILTNTQVTSVTHSHHSVSSVTTNNSKYPVIALDNFIWTTPLFALIKLCELNFQPQYKPKLSQIVLHHFVFDRDFATDNFHIYCNDPELDCFRITLYSNIAEENETNGAYRCTVETLVPEHENLTPEKLQTMDAKLLEQLSSLGITAQGSKVLFSANQITPNGFPVYTNGFVNELARQRECLKSLENLTLLGKASANNFFMNDVLVEVYRTLSEDGL